jgi:hypothetical protein
MLERVRQTPFIHDPPVMIVMGQCPVCGQAAVIDPEADPYQQHLWIHQNKPCPGLDAGKLLNSADALEAAEQHIFDHLKCDEL